MSKKKITVVGMGYVGLSNLLLLAPHHIMTGYEINVDRLQMLQKGDSPLNDKEIKEFLTKYHKQVRFVNSKNDAFESAQYIIISTPTDYDEKKNYFNTNSVIKVIEEVGEVNPEGIIIIKSTIPFGFINSVRKRYPSLTIIFSPEFLREGRALYDNLHPSRIVVGDNTKLGYEIAGLFKNASLDQNTPIICSGANEAEAIKLFANNYLAMRVAYFNELDSFALTKGIDTQQIIEGISSDPRIGNGYNNPSFGYGGYCLPKDTKQLLANFSDVPQNMIQAIVDANETRKNFLVHSILKKNPKVVGIYRLVMKEGSDNFRSSSIQDVIYKLHARNIEIIIYEPTLTTEKFDIFQVYNDLELFASASDMILANRIDEAVKSFNSKIFTRDLFHEN